MRVKILGTGAYAPERTLTNAELEKRVDTSDAWIVERTGIRTRRIAADGQPTSALASRAGGLALEAARVAPEEIDTLIVATSSPDSIVPPTACYVQRDLGLVNAGCSDLVAACSGFAYALHHGRALVSSGQSRRCLIVGAEELSRITNYQDRGTCILFGDGAGAAVLGPSDDASDIVYSKMGSDGRLHDLIVTPALGIAGAAEKRSDPAQYGIQMKGREVYKFAVPKFVEIIQEAVRAAGLNLSEIAHFIPHQMNARMIEAVAERLSLPMERVVMNIERFGNTSAASIPIALDEAVRSGRNKKGDLILGAGMGAGITWGTFILRW
ncbi:MAG TPA: beta-ketoacyl-ACP synthase III [Planctomycetota bacterium]|nr:beta-ketoacyl-ACP synthase III [Planctomycetota bacterium]